MNKLAQNIDHSDINDFRKDLASHLEREFVSHIPTWEANQSLPLVEILSSLYDAGFLSTRYPSNLGGYDKGFEYHFAMAEEIGKIACGAFGMSITIHQDMTCPILVSFAHTDLEQNLITEFLSGRKVLAHAVSETGAGSDLSGITSHATKTRDGYILNGNKCMVSLATQASHFVVLVKTDSKRSFPWGMTLFIVDSRSQGVEIGPRIPLMGHRPLDVCDVSFQDVFIEEKFRLGAEGFGYVLQARQFEEERILAAARANAMAEAMLDTAIGRAQKRLTFGKHLIEHQSMRYRLAKMRSEVELSKASARKASSLFIENEPISVYSSSCKYTSCRLAREVSDEIMQVFGASGYEEGSETARWYRDARLLSLSTGSEEVMLQSVYQMGEMIRTTQCDMDEDLRKYLENLISNDPVSWRQASPEKLREVLKDMGAKGFYQRSLNASNKIFPRFRIYEIVEEKPGGSLGLALATHLDIALPLIERYGTSVIKEQWVSPSLSGELILALALSESSAGSDLASISTTYEKTDNGWVLNGTKRYVSNGLYADGICVLAKNANRPGHFSLFLVPTNIKGVSCNPVLMMGNPSTTSDLQLLDVNLDTSNLLGAEGQGLLIQVMQLSVERLVIAIRAVAIGQRMSEGIRNHLNNRMIYGAPLTENQALQHRLAGLETRLYALSALVGECKIALSNNHDFSRSATIAKWEAGILSRNLADFAMQIRGGRGYQRDNEASWDFLDARALSLAGGTDEMMLETIANLETRKK